jgi:pimeloyl-ACP methyl ester carboxylesterase
VTGGRQARGAGRCLNPRPFANERPAAEASAAQPGLPSWIGRTLPGLRRLASSRSPPTEFADVLDEYVAHFGWDRFAIVAHSLGGWAALSLARALLRE